MKYKLLLILLITLKVSVSQENSKFKILQNSKGEFVLTNSETQKVIYKKCALIQPILGLPPNTHESVKNYLFIQKGKDLILFNSEIEKSIFTIECEYSKKISALYNNESSYYDSLVEKLIIKIEISTKNKYPKIILFNLKTSKIIYEGSDVRAELSKASDLIKLTDGVGSTSSYRIIDFNGKVIVNYTSNKDFYELSNGYITRDANYRVGVVNRQGVVTVPFIYKKLKHAVNGYIIADNIEDRAGVINSNGKIIIPFEYRTEHRNYYPHYIFSIDGVFVFHKNFEDGNLVLVDTNNTILVPTGTYIDVAIIDYDYTSYLFVQQENELKGIYNTKLRKEVFPCEYLFYRHNKLLKFGLIEAYKNGKWGLLNINTGVIQIPFDYQSNYSQFIENDSLKYFQLMKDGKMGAITLTGKELIPFIYENIKSVDKGLIRVKSNGLYGLIDAITFEIVLPCEYSRISEYLDIEKIEGSSIKKGSLSQDRTVIWKK